MPNLPKIESAGVVMVGSFNPSIINPEWLERHGIINEDQKKYAFQGTDEISHKTISRFRISNDIEIIVTVDRFQVLGEFVRNLEIRDFVIQTFELLEFTPVKAIGVNRDMHFEIFTEKEFENVCKKFFSSESLEEKMKKPKMKSLQVIGDRQDGYDGFIQVTIEPSAKIRNGLFVQVNNHIEKMDSKENLDLSDTLEAVNESWNSFMADAVELARGII